MRVIQLIILLTALSLISSRALAFVASSTNYVLERDSINAAGVFSSSLSFQLEDTVGEAGTGRPTSSSYILEAGYQQSDVPTIGISAPDDVTLLPEIPQAGGSASGSASWTVTTDNATGYTLSISASANPALRQADGSSFANYTPAGAPLPDYSWSVELSKAEFGFSPDGSDVDSNYKDNGSVCGSGSDNSGVCWDSIATSNKTIAIGSVAVTTGVSTSVVFRAQATVGSSPAPGAYSAVVTLTAVTN